MSGVRAHREISWNPVFMSWSVLCNPPTYLPMFSLIVSAGYMNNPKRSNAA
jgi:hypothetical protein